MVKGTKVVIPIIIIGAVFKPHKNQNEEHGINYFWGIWPFFLVLSVCGKDMMHVTKLIVILFYLKSCAVLDRYSFESIENFSICIFCI